MSDHLAHHGDHRWSSTPGATSSVGARLPARLRRRRALLVPPAVPDRAVRTAS